MHRSGLFGPHPRGVGKCSIYRDIPPPSNVAANLLTRGVQEVYRPFNGLLARPEEPVGVPSLFYSPLMAQLIISPLLTSAMEVSDLV